METGQKRSAILMGWLLLAAGLAGCPASRPAVSDEEGLVGQVFFPGYKVQANISDVATAATVSLIDPVHNETKATSLTDARGRFTMSFKGASLANQVYYLEAVKGLNSNRIGHDAVRVRTLVQRQGSTWTSLTSQLAGTPIVLNTATTALSLIVSLRRDTSPATPSLLIGMLTVGPEGDVFYDQGTGIAASEYTQVRNLAGTALAADVDPFYAMQYAEGTYTLKAGATGAYAPTITYLEPPMVAMGGKVVIHGAGFSPTIGGNVVTFNPAVGAVVTTASETAIEVTVPSGATNGELRVAVGSETATATFTVIPPVTGGLDP